MVTLRILIDGQERFSEPFPVGKELELAALLLDMASKFRAVGRSVALLESGNLAMIYPFSTMGKTPLPIFVPEEEVIAATEVLRDIGFDEDEAENAAIRALEAAVKARHGKKNK